MSNADAYSPESAPNLRDRHVIAALEEYKTQLSKLLKRDNALELLEDHTRILEHEMDELAEVHQRTRKLPADNPIKSRKIALLDQEITTNYLAIHAIKTKPDKVFNKLSHDAAVTLKALNGDSGHQILEDTQTVARKYVERFYKGSREETEKRYKPMDYWYAIGQERAFNKPTSDGRAMELALIPKPVQRAKWRLLFALADSAYHITGPSEPGAPDMAEAEHAVMSRLLSRLSMHERWKGSPYMPDSHKLRSNPAIHSLHAVALVDKLFHEVEIKIKQEHPRGNNAQHMLKLAEWSKLRHRAMHSTLLHDMGELDGELNTGSARINMNEEEKIRFKAAARKDEEETFPRHLEKRLIDCVPDPAMRDTLRREYSKAFKEAEELDTFVGLFVKSAERIQSQQDQLRFNPFQETPRLHDAKEAERDFSLNYVSEKLRDAPYNKPQGPQPLYKLARQEGGASEAQIAVREALCDELHKEYDHMIKKLCEAFEPGVTPDYVAASSAGRSR